MENNIKEFLEKELQEYYNRDALIDSGYATQNEVMYHENVIYYLKEKLKGL